MAAKAVGGDASSPQQAKQIFPARSGLRTLETPSGQMIIEDAGAQVYASGPQVLTYISDVDDSEQTYGLNVPPAFDPSKLYPLVLSLHGAGSNHRLNLRQVFGKGQQPGESMAQVSRSFPPLPAVHYLVASVLARGTMGPRGRQDGGDSGRDHARGKYTR